MNKEQLDQFDLELTNMLSETHSRGLLICATALLGALAFLGFTLHATTLIASSIADAIMKGG